MAELLPVLFVFAAAGFYFGFELNAVTQGAPKQVQPSQLNRADVEAILGAAHESTDGDLTAYVDQIMAMRPQDPGPRRGCHYSDCDSPAIYRIVSKKRNTYLLCDLHYRESKQLGQVEVEERLA